MANSIEFTRNPRVRLLWGPGMMARLRTYPQQPTVFRGYGIIPFIPFLGYGQEMQLIGTVEGSYNTEEEARIGAEEFARRMRGEGIYVQEYYPIFGEDGKWAAYIEHEAPREEPVVVIEEPKKKSALRYIAPIGLGVGILGVLGYAATHKK